MQVTGRSIDGIGLPKVSLILVNWNYAQFIEEAIASVKAQDYPNFECIILDNASADDSVTVIEKAISGDDRFQFIKLDTNYGQLGAGRIALNKVSGNFIGFIDSDDILFPEFLSTHIQLHLALPRSVGFTSSNVLEVDAVGDVLTSRYAYLNLDAKVEDRGLRAMATVARLPTVSDESYVLLDQQTLSLPSRQKGWNWSPGTANLFRASIVRLLDPTGPLEPMMGASDAHFAPLCHAFAGSAVTGVPMSAYRIHGGNALSGSEAIAGMQTSNQARLEMHMADSYERLDMILTRFAEYQRILGNRIWQVLNTFTCLSSHDLQAYFATERGLKVFLKNARTVRNAAGDSNFIRNIATRFPLAMALKIIREGFEGRLSLAAVLLAVVYRRKRHRKKYLN